jgi:hypothetical protein
MALLLKHQTVSAFVSRFREAYRESSRERTIQLAKFILSRIASNDITDNQCKNAFGLTTVQWTVLKQKMQSWVDQYNSSQAAQGE